MIAQAAHIPVHLGAMHESVAAVRALVPAPRPGDVFILNDPYTGGSHLPDITLIGADRKSTRLNSSHSQISYAVFCLKKKKKPKVFLDPLCSCIFAGAQCLRGPALSQLGAI